MSKQQCCVPNSIESARYTVGRHHHHPHRRHHQHHRRHTSAFPFLLVEKKRSAIESSCLLYAQPKEGCILHNSTPSSIILHCCINKVNWTQISKRFPVHIITYIIDGISVGFSVSLFLLFPFLPFQLVSHSAFATRDTAAAAVLMVGTTYTTLVRPLQTCLPYTYSTHTQIDLFPCPDKPTWSRG